MEQTIYNLIVVPVIKFLTVHVSNHLGYVISSSKHVTNMKDQLSILKNTEIPRDIPGWVSDVENFMDRVERMSIEGYGCSNIKTRYRVGKKACEYSQRIERFNDKKSRIHRSEVRKPTGRVGSILATSLPHGVRYKSREKQFKKVLKLLQQDNNKSQVIALCGMGGIGKTTMMEELKTVANNQKMFDFIVHIVIGRAPKMDSIQNDIQLNLSHKDLVEQTLSERARCLSRTFKDLEDKKERILLILDDVWPGNIQLKNIGLTSPLPNGLKLLLTSRFSDICKQIAESARSNFEEIKVNLLEEDEARNLFFEITNVSKEDDLYAIGCQIVKKCGGLPLAIDVIGETLYTKEKCYWNDALRRLKNNNLHHDVEEVMKISYDFIKNKEDKEVFLLCGLFPEDSIIRIEDLTCYAWGLNLFEGVSTLGDARDSTKTCVGNLIKAHLLIDCDGCVKMHDVVLDFVLDVVSKSDRAWIIKHGDVTQLTGREEMVRESCKRMSLTCNGMSEFPQDFKYPNLSLLQLMNGDFSLKFPEDFYENMKNLQVIAYYEMKSPLMISRSPHCSTNLKSLCLYKCKLMFDISFVGDLVNLEVLRFAQCEIRRLPSAIGKLGKLKLLELTESLGSLFDRIRRRHVYNRVSLHIDNGVFENLKNLEELYMNVGSQNPIRLTDSNFEELAMISKQLRALDIEFFMKKNQMEKFSFDKLDIFNIAINELLQQDCSEKNSCVLKLMNIDCSSDLHDCNINKLFKKTEILYLEVKDMIGLEDILVCASDPHTFSSLKYLKVSGCSKLKYLFPVLVAKGLKKLERLIIRNCPVMEALIQKDESEISGVVELPQLRQLYLYDLPNFTSIYPVNNNSNICSLFDSQVKFAKLEELRICKMEKLKQIWGYEFGSSEEEEVNNISMLREIEVNGCDSLVNLFPSNPMRLLTHLERLQVESCGSIKELFNINLECVGHGIENNISMLRDIRVVGCDSLVNLFPANPMRLLNHLESLYVANCGSIKELFNINLECVGHEVDNSFSKLRVIEVLDCDSLVNLFPSNPMRLLTHLERLQVIKCGSVKELFNINLECVGHEVDNSFSKLRVIEVRECHSLVNLFPTNPMRLLTHLERLKVTCCYSIKVIFNIDLGYEFAQVSMNNLKSIDVSDSKNVRELWRIKSGEKNFMSICGFESVEVIKSGEKNFNTKFDMKAVSKESRDDNIHTVDLRLSKCEGMEVVFEIDVNNQQPLPTNLQCLELHEMNDMSHVWKCNNWNKYLSIIPPQRRYSSFHNLTSITIYECNRIKYLFSPLMAKLLSNLHTIEIDKCREMEEVVSNRDDDDDDKDEEEMSTTSTTATFFPHLHSLTFKDLRNLMRIGGGGQSNGTKSGVIQHKVSHVGVVSWSLCQFSTKIIISSCNGLSSVIPLDAIGQMQKLEVLKVEDCESLKEVFESQHINGNSGDSRSSININKGSVDIDAISRQSNINMARLSNLKILVIESCNLLQHVFTFSMLESLKHLEKLIIKDCKAIKVIVEKENGEQTKDVDFRSLKSIRLHSLPNLESFFLGMNNFNWSLLKKVKIIKCPQMMNFTCGESTTPALKDIHTSLGRHSLECGLNFHHLKIHQTLSVHNFIDLRMGYDDKVKCIIPSNELLQLQKLETIDVYDCKLVEEVFEVEGTNEGTNSESQIVVEIPNLTQMKFICLESLKYIWKSNQRRVLKFPNLTTLSIMYCGSLKHVFTSSMVGGLLQLQDLEVGSCENMEVIVKIEEEDEVKEEMELFPCLKSLELKKLKSLKGFCSRKVNFSWPLLHTLKVPACPEITDMLLLQH